MYKVLHNQKSCKETNIILNSKNMEKNAMLIAILFSTVICR